MSKPFYPSLYQINTRILLGELPRSNGRKATLDQIPDAYLDQIAAQGFDWVWLLGVWQTGPLSREVSRGRADWRRGFLAALPDLTEEDITGSPFAIQNYSVHTDFGGEEALANVRGKLKQRGLRLLLDFVPNHMGLDHAWAIDHPDYFIQGSAADLAREPHNYRPVQTSFGSRVLAHGRDPYFPGWPDTLQLNYRSLKLRQAMTAELVNVAQRCDGVRCDMAMLLLPEVIQRTWGNASMPADGSLPIDAPFWPEAIARVRSLHPEFKFMAEVYWDLEWTLQQQGFDTTYDKRLYDRLERREAEAVRGHLHADMNFQRRLVRFLENHDEPRAAATLPAAVHWAAAILTYFTPGLRFFHEGQLEGRRVQVSMHLGRRPKEPPDPRIQGFYHDLLALLKRPLLRTGTWRLLDAKPAWEGNGTWNQFIAFSWEEAAREHLLVVVNFGPNQAQCYLPLAAAPDRMYQFKDLLSTASYDRPGADLAGRGLYLDMPPWHYHVFVVG